MPLKMLHIIFFKFLQVTSDLSPDPTLYPSA